MAVEAEKKEKEAGLMTEANKKKRKAADRKGLLPALCNGMWMILTMLVILLCLPFALPNLMGVQAYAIVSGSMEPEIPTGSLIYVEAVEPGKLEPGEIATFRTGDGESGIVTHRVVENRKSEKELVTRGDANQAPDPRPVPYIRVIGRVKGHVPCLGWLYPLVSGIGGKLRLLGLLLAALLFRLVGRIL